MRDFKLKLHIIWCLLTDKYTNSTRYKCWWLWSGKKFKHNIMITFDADSFKDRSHDMRKKLKGKRNEI